MGWSNELQQMQRYGRRLETYRHILLKDIIVNARLLQHRPDEEVELRLGGLLHAVWSLYGLYEPSAAGPGALAEQYAREELSSYAQSEEEVEKLREWARANGVIFRFLPVEGEDGVRRWVIVSHLRQTTFDGTSWEAGEVVVNPLRQTIPASERLEKLEHG